MIRRRALARLGLGALGAGAALGLVAGAPAATERAPTVCPLPLPTPVPPADVGVHVGLGVPPAVPVRMAVGQTLRLSATSDCRVSYRVAGLAPAGSSARRVLKQVRSRPLPPGRTGITWSLYRAIRPGRVTLEAYGVPVCPPGKVCAAVVYTFPVRVIVTRCH
jgi:hypothetical protein